MIDWHNLNILEKIVDSLLNRFIIEYTGNVWLEIRVEGIDERENYIIEEVEGIAEFCRNYIKYIKRRGVDVSDVEHLLMYLK